MVAGKLNQTPKSLNSTGKRELLEILRIWILQVLDLRQKDLQTVAFGKFMKGLSGLPRKKNTLVCPVVLRYGQSIAAHIAGG